MRTPGRLLATVLLLFAVLVCAKDPDPQDPGLVRRFPATVLDGKPREIVPGVYTLGEFFPVTLYLIATADDLVLVDTGFSQTQERVVEAIRALGFDPSRLRHILLTHLHLDHWMATDRLRSLGGARVYCGAEDARQLEAGAAWDRVMPARPQIPGVKVATLAVDQPLEGDQHLAIAGLDLEALATPGHTAGSTCYLLRKDGLRILFTGDTIMSLDSERGTYTARLHPRFGGDAQRYLDTLRRLDRLDVDVVLPGHPYFDRDAAGHPPAPFPSRAAWHAQIGRGIAELAQTLGRFERDGRHYLDGEPQTLGSKNLFTLGIVGEQACYGLGAGAGLVLFDPSGSSATLRARLEQLGHVPADAAAVFVTGFQDDRTGLVAELLAQDATSLYGRGPPPSLASHPRFHGLTGGETVKIGDLVVEVIATPVLGPDRLSFVVVVGNHTVALTGDAVRPITADTQPFPATLAVAPADRVAAQRGLNELGRRPIDVWLPGRPFAAQNAYLYDDEWAAILRINANALWREGSQRR